MLDIIIPSYNDERGLYQTLFSLCGITNNDWQIYIIDDKSTVPINYDKIKETFKDFYNITVWESPINVGPGGSREFGLQLTKNKYIMFIDCGDLVILPQNIIAYLDMLEEENLDLIFCAHLEENEDKKTFSMAYPVHNRMHGKIYRRSFLQQYNIHFNVECSRANEDIGFNYQCRMIARYLKDAHNKIILREIEEPLVAWLHNENSIVRQNHYAFSFQAQNIGLAKNFEFAFNNVKNYIEDAEEYLSDYFIDVFSYLYVMYLNAVIERPEFVEDSLAGAQYFYNRYREQLNVDVKVLAKNVSKELYEAYINNDALIYSLENISMKEFIKMLEASYAQLQ